MEVIICGPGHFRLPSCGGAEEKNVPLAEAVIYLRRAVRRRVGGTGGVVVRFVAVDSTEARQSPWGGPKPHCRLWLLTE